jgi:hypothetical protein
MHWSDIRERTKFYPKKDGEVFIKLQYFYRINKKIKL